jgi:non-ribosomal peptide synthetase component E (peptide arylation enzyme)
MLLIGDSLARNAVRDPPKVALIFEDQALSYAELDGNPRARRCSPP